MTSLHCKAFLRIAMCFLYHVRSQLCVVISPKVGSYTVIQHATNPCDLLYRVSLPWICTCWLQTPIQKAHPFIFAHGVQSYHRVCTMLWTMFQVIARYTSDTTLLFGLTLVTLEHRSEWTSPRAEINTICWHQVR